MVVMVMTRSVSQKNFDVEKQAISFNSILEKLAISLIVTYQNQRLTERVIKTNP